MSTVSHLESAIDGTHLPAELPRLDRHAVDWDLVAS